MSDNDGDGMGTGLCKLSDGQVVGAILGSFFISLILSLILNGLVNWSPSVALWVAIVGLIVGEITLSIIVGLKGNKAISQVEDNDEQKWLFWWYYVGCIFALFFAFMGIMAIYKYTNGSWRRVSQFIFGFCLVVLAIIFVVQGAFIENTDDTSEDVMGYILFVMILVVAIPLTVYGAYQGPLGEDEQWRNRMGSSLKTGWGGIRKSYQGTRDFWKRPFTKF